MAKGQLASPVVITVAVFVGVLLGGLGSSLFRPHYLKLPFSMAYIAPRLRQLPVSVEDLLAVEVYVDSNGRVQDYRALSNARGLKNLPPEIKNLLIFTTFRPATFMGRQTTGTATLLFAHTGVAAIPSSALRGNGPAGC